MRNYCWLLGLGFLFMMSCGDGTAEATASAAKAGMTKAAKSVSKVQGDAINVRISNGNAKTGEQTCLSFVVNDFNQILGYQHSIKFNPAELKYTSTRNHGIPNLNESNFGATKAAEGSINFLWFDMNVKGVSIADRSNLFDMCFEVLAPKGTKCEVSITDQPIKREVVGPQKKKLKLNSTPGFITVE